ncbi:MAG TPA: response regulator transcription factor [Candidatus Limnocylindria bacterium]|jgi:DNA-binding NarL/FixJ family response regulator
MSNLLSHRVRVVVAEHHPSIRENLRYLIDAERDMECVGVAKNGRQCLDLCAELRPEVVIVDEILPGADGIAVTAILRHRQPEVRVVMYTFDETTCEVARVYGAANCVRKDVPYAELLGAIRRAGPGAPKENQPRALRPAADRC